MSKIRRKLATTAVVSASVMVALLVSSAPAQAAWQAPGKPDSRFHCTKGYNKVLAPVWFQDCVVVTRTPSGAYVQSVMPVSNLGSTSAGLYGQTWTYLDGRVLTRTDCGYTVIAAGARKWCWGKTTYVAGHRRYVQGRGWLRRPGGVWYFVWSPTWPT